MAFVTIRRQKSRKMHGRKMVLCPSSIFASFLKKNRPNLASFCLFSSFSQHNDKYNTKFHYKRKNHRWCALDFNPGPQNGRRRQIHLAMMAPKRISHHVGIVFNMGQTWSLFVYFRPFLIPFHSFSNIF